MKGELIVDARNVIGECCFQDPRDGCIYWTDIEGRKIFRLSGAGEVSRFTMPGRAGFILPLSSPGFVIGFPKQVVIADQELREFTRIVDVETDIPGTRINDAAVDPFGGVVFGTFNEVADPDRRPVCSLYRLSPEGDLQRLLSNIAISNGTDFSPDGSIMYFADTADGRIRRFRVGAADFSDLEEIEPLATAADAPGLPDGGCVDAAGNYWSARVWGSCAIRFSPEGKPNGRVDIPVKGPTCVALCGPDLDQLHITSLRTEHSAEELRAAPEAGGLFRAGVDVPGCQQRLCHLRAL
ncbi:MAG: SMP-30/gluconolactonase/LRE family protein [Rhodobacteraceae bacterium]|nr:SMP-30/gluconolactonase/LRE family protein [Paracoccaceae bacterium]